MSKVKFSSSVLICFDLNLSFEYFFVFVLNYEIYFGFNNPLSYH